MTKLSVEKRDTKTDAEAVRKSGLLPAVLYGRKEESTPISVAEGDFERTLREAGESTIITLSGVGDDKDALIHDVDFHPVTDKPIHADFYVIEKGRKLEIEVPLEFVGEAPVVKDKGGILIKVMHELEIEALPQNLPHEIEVDISGVTDFDSQITVGDLKMPEGVTPLAELDEVVVAAEEPKEEEEEEEEETEIDMEAIGVAGKDGEEGEEVETAEGDGTPKEAGGEESEQDER